MRSSRAASRHPATSFRANVNQFGAVSRFTGFDGEGAAFSPGPFEPGGHLVNLSQPAVPWAILRALDGSAESPENPKMRAAVEAKEAPATEFRAKGRSQNCVRGGKLNYMESLVVTMQPLWRARGHE